MVIDSNLIVAIVSVVVGSAIGVSSNYWYKKQFDSSQKQHYEQSELSKKQQQMQGLLEAFRILDSTDHRRSRTMVYVLYFEYLDTQQLTSFKSSTEVEDVRADFDIMGMLVKTENIEKNNFLEMYGALAYRCWQCLKADIENERGSRGFPQFMSYFQELAKEAEDYWKNKKVDLSKTKLYHPDDPSRSVGFQPKVKN